MERKWEEMAVDCMVNVFERLSIIDLTVGIPFLCKSWHRASLDPRCWRILDLSLINFGPRSVFVDKFKAEHRVENFSFAGFLKFLINRRSGCVEELLLPSKCSLADLTYISNQCPSLKALGLPLTVVRNRGNLFLGFAKSDEVEKHVIELVAKSKDLEYLQIPDIHSYFIPLLLGIHVHCKKFVGLKKSGSLFNEEAMAIAIFLPELKYLNLSPSLMSKEALMMILRGCKELDELVLKDCCGFEVDEEILKMASHIKVLDYEGLRLDPDDQYFLC